GGSAECGDLCRQSGRRGNLRFLRRLRCLRFSERSADLGTRGARSHGLLLPPRNPEALAKEIDALANQPEFSRKIAQNGMQLARETYNWDRFADQISRVCQEVVERDGAAVLVSEPVSPLTRQ